MGIEKRNKERVSVSLAAVLDFSSGAREARVSDISMGGCFIDSIANVVENENLSLKLNLSSGESVKFYGVVTYIYPGVGFGIRFLHLTDAEKSVLKQILVSHGGKALEFSDSSNVEEETQVEERKITARNKVSEEMEKKSFEDIKRSIQESLDDKSKN